jgi:hypothetical protein
MRDGLLATRLLRSFSGFESFQHGGEQLKAGSIEQAITAREPLAWFSYGDNASPHRSLIRVPLIRKDRIKPQMKVSTAMTAAANS